MSVTINMPTKFVMLTRLAVEERLSRLEAERQQPMSDAEQLAWDDEHAYGNDLPIYRLIHEILTEAMESNHG